METFELLEALATEESSPRGVSSASERPLVVLGNVLFAHTGGQPLYLLETLKLLRERQYLLPRLTEEGVFRLAPAEELVTALARQESRRELLPPSVRVLTSDNGPGAVCRPGSGAICFA